MNDFWKMVRETQSRTIVMLCNLEENGMVCVCVCVCICKRKSVFVSVQDA